MPLKVHGTKLNCKLFIFQDTCKNFLDEGRFISMFHLRESAGGVNGLEGTTVHLVLKPRPDNKSQEEPRVDAVSF